MAGVATAISQTLKSAGPFKKADIPLILRKSTGNLYEVLSRTPASPVGMEIHQTRWTSKQIGNSYWVVTRAQFKDQGKHGKAWGKLYWRGTCVSDQEERIRGSLKYSWKEGRSKALGVKPASGTETQKVLTP